MTEPHFTSTDFWQATTYGTGPMHNIINEFEPDDVKAARMAGVNAMAKRLSKDAASGAWKHPAPKGKSRMPIVIMFAGIVVMIVAAATLVLWLL